MFPLVCVHLLRYALAHHSQHTEAFDKDNTPPHSLTLSPCPASSFNLCHTARLHKETLLAPFLRFVSII